MKQYKGSENFFKVLFLLYKNRVLRLSGNDQTLLSWRIKKRDNEWGIDENLIRF